jgi:hypothetical protein
MLEETMTTAVDPGTAWEDLVQHARRLGPDPSLQHADDVEVEAAVCDLAGQLAALTCRWLTWVAELVVRDIWSAQGAATPAAWLSWKVGLAPSTAREQVRVALRLRELPAIRDAFASGRLSYSKVRALTRVAVPALEPLLLRWADAATASELERIASAFRSTRRAADALDEDDRRYRWRERHLDEELTEITLRLPTEEALELRQRLERRVAVAATVASGGGSRLEAPASTSPDAEASGGPDGAPPAASGSDGDGGTHGEDEVVHLASAAELVGELVSVVLSTDPHTVADTSGLDRHTLVLQVSADDLAAVAPDTPADEPVAVGDGRGRVRTMGRSTLRRLACEAGVVLVGTGRDGTPMDVGRRQRRLTAALRRALRLRDRGRCTFPGCDATRHLHAHHVEHWADGGSTDLANLVLLCSRHHRHVHAGTWRIEVDPRGRHRFTAPAGHAALPHAGRFRGSIAGLDHVPAGPHPPDRLLPSHWAGPRTMDLDLAVAVLQQELGPLPDLVEAA